LKLAEGAREFASGQRAHSSRASTASVPNDHVFEDCDDDQEPVAQRRDYVVRVPRGAIRHLEKKAAALDARKEAGVLNRFAATSAEPVDTPSRPARPTSHANAEAIQSAPAHVVRGDGPST
jgi:hypothetical protein